MFVIEGKYNKAKVFADSVDEVTIGQIMELCNQQWVENSNIAIMADTHAGKGCTIGTTMTIHDKVCPNLVGVDIGCGMLTIKLPQLENLSLQKLDNFIHSNIPSGFAIHEKRLYNPISEGLYLEKLKCYQFLMHKESLEKAVGSLGGGNHFIEIDTDSKSNNYLIIHTGSRNLGKQVAEYYQKIAFEYCNSHEQIMKDKINQIPKDLCFLEGEYLSDYLHDMYICQHFAKVNRKYIALKILGHLFKEKFNSECGNTWIDIDEGCGYEDENIDLRMDMFETVHNYINPNDNILRKGAISARNGERVLIPINMRDGSIIGTGKGHPDYNYSGPHGAGRLMSRNVAKRSVSLNEFQDSMKGIYSTSVGLSTLDESPMAYKPIKQIIDNIKDAIEVVEIIRPIYNYKAH